MPGCVRADPTFAIPPHAAICFRSHRFPRLLYSASPPRRFKKAHCGVRQSSTLLHSSNKLPLGCCFFQWNLGRASKVRKDLSGHVAFRKAGYLKLENRFEGRLSHSPQFSTRYKCPLLYRHKRSLTYSSKVGSGEGFSMRVAARFFGWMQFRPALEILPRKKPAGTGLSLWGKRFEGWCDGAAKQIVRRLSHPHPGV